MDQVARVSHQQLIYQGVLGTGAFGRVTRAKATRNQAAIQKIQPLLKPDRQTSVDTITSEIDSSETSHGSSYHHQTYAIKTCKDESDEEMQDAIIKEAQLLAELPKNINVIELQALSDDFETSKDRFMVLELLTKTLTQQLTRWRFSSSYAQPNSLSVIIHRRKVESLQRQRIEQAGIGVANALRFLHSHRIVYRDLKPENVGFVHEIVKLFDFGLARSLPDNDTNDRRMTLMVGTLRYMSPEAMTGYYDESTDVYSFGMLLLELCVLEKPHGHILCLSRLEQQILNHQLPARLHRVCGKAIRTILGACWKRDPQVRPQMSSIAVELERYCYK